MTTDDELLALARKATPGEWRQDVMYVTAEIPGGRPGGEVIVEARATVDRHRDRARDVRNAAYIAAANPAAIIALIERHRAEVDAAKAEVIRLTRAFDAEVERLTRERDEAREMHKTMCDLALHRANETEAAESALSAAQKRVGELLQEIVDCGRWTGNISKPDEYMLDRSAFDRLRKKACAALAGKEDGDAQGAVRE